MTLLDTAWPLVIPTTGRQPLLARALRGATPPVWIIAPPDAGAEHLAAPGVTVLAAPAGGGFAAAANLALREAHSAGHDRLVLLNDDAWLEPGARQQLLAAVGTPGVAAAGAVLLTEGGDTESAGLRVRLGGGRVRAAAAAADAHRPVVVDALPATAAAYRVGPLLAAGGFDARHFPLYFEDVDLSLRLRCRGYRLLLVPGARAIHRGAATAGRGSAYQAYHQARGQVTLSRRHGGWLGAAVATTLSAATLLRQGAEARPRRALAVARGLRDAFTSAPVDARYRAPRAACAAAPPGGPAPGSRPPRRGGA